MSIREALALEPTAKERESHERMERLFRKEQEKDPLFVCKVVSAAAAVPAYIALDSIAMRLIGA